MDTDLIVKNVSKHISLTRAETDFFLSLLETRKIKRKGFLLQQGEISRTENFIVKGCMRLYSVDGNGFEHIVMFGIEDWWIGDILSFHAQTPSNYFIDALEDSELLQITKPDLEKLYKRVPKFERFFRIIIQNAFVAQQQRINQNLSFSAEERYLHFIKKYPRFEQRIPQLQVAAYLGMTPEFLSVLRGKLAKRK